MNHEEKFIFLSSSVQKEIEISANIDDIMTTYRFKLQLNPRSISSYFFYNFMLSKFFWWFLFYSLHKRSALPTLRSGLLSLVKSWYSIGLKIDECSLCLPSTSVSVERVFAVINDIWPSDKTLRHILRYNVNMICLPFFEFPKGQPKMLNDIGSDGKYALKKRDK